MAAARFDHKSEAKLHAAAGTALNRENELEHVETRVCVCVCVYVCMCARSCCPFWGPVPRRRNAQSLDT